jgi:hypothetical protein
MSGCHFMTNSQIVLSPVGYILQKLFAIFSLSAPSAVTRLKLSTWNEEASGLPLCYCQQALVLILIFCYCINTQSVSLLQLYLTCVHFSMSECHFMTNIFNLFCHLLTIFYRNCSPYSPSLHLKKWEQLCEMLLLNDYEYWTWQG